LSLRIGTVAAHFRRDLRFDVDRVLALVEEAHDADVQLLALPHAALGGYVGDLDPDVDEPPDLPPTCRPDGPELAEVVAAAGPLVVCLGFTEAVGDGGLRANTAVCLDGSGLLGLHRKVHLPSGEIPWYVPGDRFEAFDTPVGRLGLMIDYDKSFPEAARSLALAGAEVLVVCCAWPASRTNRAARLVQDRQTRLYDIYDQARAAENQVVLVSANQTGTLGALRYIGQSKVVGPDGAIIARVGARAGLVVADVDVSAAVTGARRRLHHLAERRPSAYAPTLSQDATPSDDAERAEPSEP
jgi:predicted amidohydrolase